MTEELKPCPLCGNKQVYFSDTMPYHQIIYPAIFCDSVDCNLIAEFDTDVITKKQAAKRWNRRPTND